MKTADLASVLRLCRTGMVALAVATLAWAQPARGQAADAKPQPKADEEKAPDKALKLPASVTAKTFWDTVRLSVEEGGSTYELQGDHPAKFQENRDVPRGLYVKQFTLDFLSPDSPYWASLNSTEIRERDQRLTLDGGRVGRWRSSFVWDEIPKLYSTDSPSLFANAGSGYLQVSPAIRALFQSLVDGQNPTAVNPALYAAVRNELALARRVDVGTNRDTSKIRESFRPVESLEMHFEASKIRMTGTQPLGMGTFARQNNVPNPPFDQPCATRPLNNPCDGNWEALDVELPAPVDFRTIAANAGVAFTGSVLSLGADYDVSQFRSPFSAITYENPFRITDAQGNPPGSAVGRNRQVLQQHAVAPNSTENRFTLHAGFELPLDTQVRGMYSWAQTTQTDQFLPYTLNTALVVARVGGSANLPTNFNPMDPSFLPQQNLNGRVDTQHHDYSLVSRPVKSLTFRLQYRSEDQDNKSSSITFPGMSRFGESHWVTSNDYYGNALRNYPTSFERQDYIAEIRWDALPGLTVSTDFDHQIIDRTFRDVPRTSEDAVRGRIDFRPSSAVSFKGSFLYSDRTPNIYKTIPFVYNAATNTWEIVRNADNGPNYNFEPGVPLESPLLRRYDETSRIRKEAKGSLDLRVGEITTFSATSRYRNDAYSLDAYGLNFERNWGLSGEFTVTPTDWSHFFASYSWDEQRQRMQGIGSLIDSAVSGATGCCAQYPINNTWVRNSRSTLDSVVVGGNFATAAEKTVVDASYAYSYAKDRITTFNPFPILANSPRTALAYNYPDTINKFQEAIVTVTQRISKALQVGLQCRYEAYKIDDFYLNDLSAYPQGFIVRGGIPSNLPRQILLDARYGNYIAKQASVFVRYRFNDPR